MIKKEKMENIIFKAIVGSQSYGTNIATSDVDYKGVYIQKNDELIGFGYKEQIDVSKDECYYEVRRFLQLLQSANPTVLELLYSPSECIVEKKPVFDIIVAHRDKFLTKKCLHSFGGYAIAQIKKARGLDKKMNWEKERIIRKTPLDFIYFYQNGKTILLEKWLNDQHLSQEFCGLVALDHFKDAYALYYDKDKNLNFKGIAFEESNDIRLSSVPKNIDAISVVYFNKEAYSKHCKDFRQYQEWLDNRNTQRYIDTNIHNQKIDGKNLMHCRRLLDMAIEIATEKTIKVKRPNANQLLSIRKGEMSLDKIIEEAEIDIQKLEYLFQNSDLPDEIDAVFVNNLLLEVRHF